MAKPTSILEGVKGMVRDFDVDQLPKSYVWDLLDYIPSRHAAPLEGRGPWTFMTAASLAGTIWGGADAIFFKGEKLLVCAGNTVYDHPRIAPGAAPVTPTSIGTLWSTGTTNGKMLNDRCWFSDGATGQIKAVVWTGASPSIVSAHATTTGTIIEVYKGRLINPSYDLVDPTGPSQLWFGPLEIDGGPLVPQDPLSYIQTSRPITALGVLQNMVLCFHDGSTERIRGGIPPATNVDTDMELDTLSNQYGCVDPKSVVNWQENLIFANSHGVHMTDGSSIRSLTDQGGIGELWRYAYGLKRSGTGVSAAVFLNYLFVTILTTWTGASAIDDRSTTFVCDLGSRSWFRFQNVDATAMIPSQTGVEQVWWGTDTQNIGASMSKRIAHLSPTIIGLSELDPENPGVGSFPNAVDANGVNILPRVSTGFNKLGDEGQKRIRQVYISQATQAQASSGDVLSVRYKLTPTVGENWLSIGGIPASARYDRKRLPVGRAAYGIQVSVIQTQPTRITRLYDIAIDGWPQDRGKVS